MANESAQTHGVMFHHFHSEKHPVGQGSISGDQFSSMLDWLEDRYSILSPDEYTRKLVASKLRPTDICLTFDDALLCQSDIAAPIMKKRNLQAFFFVYSSPFIGNPDFLEIYRHFRNTEYGSMEDFYSDFFLAARQLLQEVYDESHAEYTSLDYLKDFPFYTEGDRWFRYLRDRCLGKDRYEELMALLMRAKGFDHTSVLRKLWMNENSVQELIADGHTVGLHSFSHPTTLHLLDRATQENEYVKNYRHISEVIGTNPTTMSHPCGNYNNDTLEILDSKGVSIGFRSNMGIKEIRSTLEVPREDHSNILKEMSK